MTQETAGAAQICFVDMPFGKKVDPQSGDTIDFDAVFAEGIEPAIEEAGLRPVRGDQEKSGGIIHRAMFARLLLSEFVVADLTTANANVFYELGVRHAAKPYTTVPIFATTGGLPFDVAMVRAIPYELENGVLTEASAAALRKAIIERIHSALTGPVAEDSPLFQLFDDYPGIQLSHEITDVFMDRIQVSEAFQHRLDEILAAGGDVRRRLAELQDSLGELKACDNEILMRLYLTYRNVSAWDEMVALYDEFPASLQASPMAIQQLALALNRRAKGADRKRAIERIEKLIRDTGPSAESYGILGRIYKDQYREEAAAGAITADAKLDKAIAAYTKGFEAEPADYYPGINAINLLIQKGTEEAQEEADRLTPLVSFAVARRGGAASEDYWDLATVLELAVIGRDEESARGVIAKVIETAEFSWMAQTTADNLDLVLALRRGKEDTRVLEQVIAELRKRQRELPSGEG